MPPDACPNCGQAHGRYLLDSRVMLVCRLIGCTEPTYAWNDPTATPRELVFTHGRGEVLHLVAADLEDQTAYQDRVLAWLRDVHARSRAGEVSSV